MQARPPPTADAAWILAPEEGSEPRIFGLSPAERLRRSLVRAGCDRVTLLRGGSGPELRGKAPALLVRGDWIYDERLIEALRRAPGRALVDPISGAAVAACVSADRCDAGLEALRRGAPPAGIEAFPPDSLAPAYTPKLRKSEPPYLLPARPGRESEIEARIFAASYKGATDLVTKWVWPRPALAATRWLARLHVHPNSVTVASWALALAAFTCFWTGAFATGLLVAWLMTFLDTVDGKLARVTLTSSRIGDVLDHGLDLVHPPFWWWAWGVGLGWAGHPATWVAVGGYFAGRALEGVFLATFALETHSWRPIDTLFRTITARRNPNLILLSVGTLAGRPDLGLVMLALWTLASLLFHATRLAQAFAARARGEPPTPWDRTPPGEPSPPGGSS